MTRTTRALAGRALAAGVAAAAALFAWRTGGGAEPPHVPPRADAPAPAPRDARADRRDVYEAAIHLAPPRQTGVDRREAMVVAAGSTQAFDVRLPRGAELAFAEGTVAATRAPITFSVTVVDETGASHEVHRRVLPPGPAGRWIDAVADLSAFSGQNVKLRFATSALPKTLAVWGDPVVLAKRPPKLGFNVVLVVADAPRAASIDALASRGVSFTHAYAAATWSPPATLAMLAGGRPDELGIDAAGSRDPTARVYASDPPLLPRVLRAQGAVAAERWTAEGAASFIERSRERRFFLLVNAPDAGSAIARKLDEVGLSDRTIVVATAAPARTVANTEAATRVPLVVVAPGLLPAGTKVQARVRAVDLAPTVLELLGIEASPRMSGRSLVALAKGGAEPDERVVVTFGPGSRAITFGRHRLVLRDGARLFDLDADPKERADLAPKSPDQVAEMKARLDAALANVPVAGSAAATAERAESAPTLRLRFVGAGRARRVSGSIRIGDAHTKPRSVGVHPIDLGHDAYKRDGDRIDVAFTTAAAAPVGLDLTLDPPGVPVTWDLWLDDRPLAEDGVFGGPFGLRAPALLRGVDGVEARAAAESPRLPLLDPRRDDGLFVVRRRALPTGIGGVRAP